MPPRREKKPSKDPLTVSNLAGESMDDATGMKL
jgi:hypothetical protein